MNQFSNRKFIINQDYLLLDFQRYLFIHFILFKIKLKKDKCPLVCRRITQRLLDEYCCRSAIVDSVSPEVIYSLYIFHLTIKEKIIN